MTIRRVPRRPPQRGQQHLTTRILLICAALASIQALLFLTVTPPMTALAASAPPLYGLAAGVHSLMPFLARILTRTRWTATITALITGVLITPFNAVGALLLVPFAAGALSFDIMLGRQREPRRLRLIGGASIAGASLFIVSLPVFTSEHLTPVILTTTLIGRLTGELVAAFTAALIARSIRAAGVATQ